ERARDHLDEGIRKLDEMVDRLAAEEKAYAKARRELEDERRAVVDAETRRAREMAQEAADRREAAEKRLSELEDQLAGLREEVRRQQRKLKERAVELAEAEAAADQSRALAEEAERAAEALREERETLSETREIPPVEVGDRVRIPRYDLVGDVVELSRATDECTVQAGQVRISCRASEIEIVEKAADRETEERAPAEHETPPLEDSALPLEIDLRGMTADEVGFPVAGAIERAWHTGRATIRVIHGKGTGVLRRKVAEILEKHPYVEEFRLGRWNEGGDGVTIASLRTEDERREA
ncbi:MAG: Smr/MutS family protein, partial [Gemmatimonadota bacterium]|nr:Smr/MutS family protein [Gemmatimonadota bacterium]